MEMEEERFIHRQTDRWKDRQTDRQQEGLRGRERRTERDRGIVCLCQRVRACERERLEAMLHTIYGTPRAMYMPLVCGMYTVDGL